MQSLTAVVKDPQPEHLLQADLAEEYSKDHKKFCKNAEDFTKKYAEMHIHSSACEQKLQAVHSDIPWKIDTWHLLVAVSNFLQFS